MIENNLMPLRFLSDVGSIMNFKLSKKISHLMKTLASKKFYKAQNIKNCKIISKIIFNI